MNTVRSALFVPGSRPERFAKALAAGADVVIVDFEDAVEEPLKQQARDHLAAFLQVTPQASVWSAGKCTAASAARQRPGLLRAAAWGRRAAVAQVENATQVALAWRGGKPVWPIIESAKGLLALARIAAAEGVERLSFGSLDLALDLGLNTESEAARQFLDQARMAVQLHSRGPTCCRHWMGCSRPSPIHRGCNGPCGMPMTWAMAAPCAFIRSRCR